MQGSKIKKDVQVKTMANLGKIHQFGHRQWRDTSLSPRNQLSFTLPKSPVVIHQGSDQEKRDKPQHWKGPANGAA